MRKCGHHEMRDARNRVDPTGTTGIRRAFESDISRRFRGLKGLITQSLVKNDGLGLKMFGDQAIQPGQFVFSRSPQKVSQFMAWLREQQDSKILGIVPGASMESAASSSWANTYIEASYQKGIRDSGAQMRAGGVQVAPNWVEQALSRPIHADRIGLTYTRVFTELRGITEAMDQQISRVLSLGIANGDGPAKIARDINNRVDKIGITRARVLARTEVIATHAEATLNGYTEAGISDVEVLSEFSTVGDTLVCPQCEDLEGKTYTLSAARGVIPVHPNCRCAWLPVIENGTGIILQ